MGTSGFVLRRRESIDFEELICDVKIAADRAGLRSRIESRVYVDNDNKSVWVEGNIIKIPGVEDIYIYICSDGYDIYDWILEGGHLIDAIIFDRIRDCEEILLNFLYEYLKRNPEDYFWAERDWYYTLNDIVRIKQKEFDPDWCYKDPRLPEENG